MQILQGDCLEIMPDIPENSVDMILCDLPYGTTDCAWDSVIPHDRLWAQYNRIIKPKGVIALFGDFPFSASLIASNIRHFRHAWYWRKNNATGALCAKVQPLKTIEHILVFSPAKKGAALGETFTYNPQGLVRLKRPVRRSAEIHGRSEIYHGKSNDSIQTHTNYPKNVLEFQNVGFGAEKRVHPTQKPVALLEYLVKTYTNAGDVVLDNCMGSGSTGIACKNTGRKFIGIEREEKYFEIARKRIAEHEVGQ